MDGQTVSLTATTAAVGVTIVSLMVPNAVDARGCDDGFIRRAHLAGLTSVAVLGLAMSVLGRSPVPFFGGMLATGLVVYAHDRIQTNGVTNWDSVTQ